MTESELGSLLVVDDNEMNRDMLSRRLERRGYAVTVAAGGAEAISRLEKRSYDAVLLDIMMPEVSGWDVLEWVRKRFSRAQLPVIMATAKESSEDIVRALQNGANDYVTKPLDLEVVLARIGTHVILKLNHARLTEANQKLKDDLAAAARVQQAYLPPRTPEWPCCEIAWYYEPCDDLGGDFLNVLDLGNGRVGLYLLDVSGHGVPAALMSVAVSRALAPSPSETCVVCRPDRARDPTQLLVTPPGRVADKLNHRFPMKSSTNQFFTLIYGVLENQSHVFRYTSAGHPPVVHVPWGAAPRLVPLCGGPPIGMFQPGDGLFDPYEEGEIQLLPGDRLYLYSDGVVEATDSERRPFGANRLLKDLATMQGASLQESLDSAMETLTRWSGFDRPFEDDVSILAVQVGD